MAHTRISSLLSDDVRATTTATAAAEQSGLDLPVLRALADVAIELRSPLSVILGHSENIRQTPEDEDEVIRSIAAIEKSGRRIDRITSDILTLGALEHEIAQKQTASTSASFQLAECLNDLRDLLENLIRDKQPMLSIEISSADCRIRGDRHFWFVAFQHLLENALTENGRKSEITIAAEHRSGITTIEFIDNGIGIPPNDLEKVFSPFYRIQRSHSVQRRGIGLGLYYVQRVVEYHSGRVSVSSVPGVQTTFRIELKCQDS